MNTIKLIQILIISQNIILIVYIVMDFLQEASIPLRNTTLLLSLFGAMQ